MNRKKLEVQKLTMVNTYRSSGMTASEWCEQNQVKSGVTNARSSTGLIMAGGSIIGNSPKEPFSGNLNKTVLCLRFPQGSSIG